jgi:hypothetical protein
MNESNMYLAKIRPVVLFITVGTSLGIALQRFAHWDWALIVCVAIGLILGLVCSFLGIGTHPVKFGMKIPRKNFLIMIIAMLLQIGVLTTVFVFLEGVFQTPWLYVALGVSLLSGGFFVYAMLGLLNNLDEMQSRIQARGITFAFITSIVAAMTYGLFELVGAPHFNTFLFVPVMVFFWLIGKLVAMKKFQ